MVWPMKKPKRAPAIPASIPGFGPCWGSRMFRKEYDKPQPVRRTGRGDRRMREPKKIVAKFKGVCRICRNEILVGEVCYFEKQPGAEKGEVTCTECIKTSRKLFGDGPEEA